MSTAQVEDAEASLETMLQDLYPSEGLSRAEALAAATRAYEEEMRAGAVRNLLSGPTKRNPHSAHDFFF